MHINFRLGFKRVCVVLTFAIAGFVLYAECSDHYRPFIRNLDCGDVSPSGFVSESASKSFPVLESDVDAAFARGLITEQKACEDMVEYWAKGPRKEAKEFMGTGHHIWVQLPGPAASRISAELRQTLAAGHAEVSLYRRIDWGPVKLGTYMLVFVWLAYGAALYIAHGFSQGPGA